MSLPVLRNDLRLYPWQPAPRTGEALWALHDPMRNRFFALPEDAIEILKCFDLGSAAQIVARVNGETARRISEGDVHNMVAFLQENQLVTLSSAQAEDALLKLKEMRREPFFNRLVHRYFFFRVPLWRPDPFLELSLALVAPFFSRWFFWATLLAGLAGIVLTIRDWHGFEYHLRNLWSFSGAAKIVLTFIFVKLVHELAHAYTAKRHGVRVPMMGVAFLFMFPFPYTDTTESWKLYRHRQRLSISAAGVSSELMMAAWATLLWKLIPSGPLQEAIFLIATTTWVSSLAINLSPFMRFDGYFVLMDYLQIPNLHKRAGDLARWKLREVLFGLGEAIPERFAPGLMRFLIGFAYVTWIYRFTVFLVIAILLFHLLPQPLGLIVFVVEIHFLILRPILRELKVWWSKRGAMTRSRRSRLAAVALVGLVVLAFFPFKARLSVPGLYEPFHEEVLYAPQDGRVIEMRLLRGQAAEKGDLLLKLGSEALQSDLERAEIAAERLSRQVGISQVAIEGTGIPAGRDRGWRAAMSQVAALQDQIGRLEIRAPLDGRIIDVAPELRAGLNLARNSPVAVMQTGPRHEIVLYVEEGLRSRLHLGESVTFFTHGAPAATLKAEVSHIEANPTRTLMQPELSSVYGGPLRSFLEGNRLVLDMPMFPVSLHVTNSELAPLRQPVTVFLYGERQSLAELVFERLAFLLRREFGG